VTDAPTRYAVLESRALLEVRGPDWRPFLQGLLTQDVLTLEPGDLRFGALLAPQGRLLFDLFIWGRDEDGCVLETARERRDALIQRLLMYRLRAKIEVVPMGSEVAALWSCASRQMAAAEEAVTDEVSRSAGVSARFTADWRLDPRLPQLGWRAIAAGVPQGSQIAGEAAYAAHRLSLGVPDPARDAQPDKTYPIEANFDLLNGVDFKKGCFVGQETTSRMKRRGQIKSRMLPLRFDGAPPPFGAEVLAGELRAGEVLTGCNDAAMALLRLDRIADARLGVDGRPVHPWRPSWMDA
jgi:tRNA-modifying protein YgfZ